MAMPTPHVPACVETGVLTLSEFGRMAPSGQEQLEAAIAKCRTRYGLPFSEGFRQNMRAQLEIVGDIWFDEDDAGPPEARTGSGSGSG